MILPSQTTLSNMAEDVLAALDSKNPNVKEETCKFLTRTISKLNQATLPKPLLKQLAPALIKVNRIFVSPAEALLIYDKIR